MTFEDELVNEIEKLREVIQLQTRIIIDCGVIEEMLADLAWGEVICDEVEVPWDEPSLNKEG